MDLRAWETGRSSLSWFDLIAISDPKSAAITAAVNHRNKHNLHPFGFVLKKSTRRPFYRP